MKVVLLKDVRKIGRAHDVVDVADGHALNHLIPAKVAVRATPAALKSADTHRAKVDEKRQMETALIKETIAHLADGHLTITRKVNEQGHLYESVTARDIAEVAKLPEDVISLEKPIKEIGRFEVPVSHTEDFGVIVVEVVAE